MDFIPDNTCCKGMVKPKLQVKYKIKVSVKCNCATTHLVRCNQSLHNHLVSEGSCHYKSNETFQTQLRECKMY